MTLDEVSLAAGLSKGHLSRFERGEKALSVAALMRLAQALQTSVSALLGEKLDDDAIHLLRRKERKPTRAPREFGGYCFSLLSRNDDAGMTEVFTIDLAIGDTVVGAVTHAGQESLYVLSGALRIEIGDQLFDLECGDYIEFDGALRHNLRSLSETASVLVTVQRR